MKKIEIRKTGTEFQKYGDRFTPIEYNEENNVWLYKRTPINGEGSISYEVVKGNTYPSSSEFGFRRAVCTTIYEKAKKYLENGIERITK